MTNIYIYNRSVSECVNTLVQILRLTTSKFVNRNFELIILYAYIRNRNNRFTKIIRKKALDYVCKEYSSFLKKSDKKLCTNDRNEEMRRDFY